MPTVHTNLLFTRDVRLPLSSRPTPESIHFASVRTGTDEAFAVLDDLCSTCGFGPGWVRAMLALEAEAVVAVAEGQAVAAGWLTGRPFFVDEIRYQVNPGGEGHYYFGDFVAPASRGQRLQQLLIHRRLELSAQAGRRWAFCLTAADNPPSSRSYEAEGFVATGRLKSSLFRRWQWDKTRRIPSSSHPDWPTISLAAGGGMGLPFSFRLRRR